MFNSAVWDQGKTLSCRLLLIAMIEIFLSKKKKEFKLEKTHTKNCSVHFSEDQENELCVKSRLSGCCGQETFL